MQVPDAIVLVMFSSFIVIYAYNAIRAFMLWRLTGDTNAKLLLRSVGLASLFMAIERTMLTLISSAHDTALFTEAGNLIVRHGLWFPVELSLLIVVIYTTVKFWDSVTPHDE